MAARGLRFAPESSLSLKQTGLIDATGGRLTNALSDTRLLRSAIAAATCLVQTLVLWTNDRDFELTMVTSIIEKLSV